jgi:hypothetical protein
MDNTPKQTPEKKQLNNEEQTYSHDWI